MHEEANLFSDPYTWYILALIIFFGVIYRYVRKPILGWLDGEIAKVKDELNQAKKLRADAAALLADYQSKQKEALSEAEDIISSAREEAVRLRAEAEANLQRALERHEQQAVERIHLAEAEALAEVRAAVIDQAMAAARAELAKKLDPALAGRLVDQAVAEVPRLAAKVKTA
ncbi:MAG: F0F1 ATP synthase subunit B [Alphaproteobacteria bacterium]|nr:F0F1 ATP synthase subunit B [Alphaproteobacteria bacterium]